MRTSVAGVLAGLLTGQHHPSYHCSLNPCKKEEKKGPSRLLPFPLLILQEHQWTAVSSLCIGGKKEGK